MSEHNGFHDLLFEVSNEYRYNILLILREQSKRIANLTRMMKLTTSEIRRHVSRLTKAGLIQRDIDGYYHLTPYGKTSLLMLQELEFLSLNKAYFKTHDPLTIPTQFVKQMGKLKKTRLITDMMDFVRHTQNLLKQSEKQVSIMVDQFPMTLLPNIVEAIDRGVEIRIIESKDQILEPDFSKLTSEESRALNRTQTTPLYERRMREDIHLQFFLSESNCVLSFPLSNNQYDYTGFYCFEERSLDWCNELYSHYWDQASPRILEQPIEVKRGYSRSDKERVTVQGVNDPSVDAQVVQDAVDNYKEVLLCGKFNLGVSSIRLSKSVIIRGEGRENNIPLTSIYKRGWSFPFREFRGLFFVDEDDLDITIENLNFTDFNFACFSTRRKRSNSVKVLNNRITVDSGYGRGVSFGAFGDTIIGLHTQNAKDVLFEGNYIDLAHGFGAHRGSVSRGGIEEDPEYRPDLFNHEYYIGYGIACNNCRGKVELKNNIVRNASGRGIGVGNHHESAEVIIRDNVIESDVYGCYPFSSRESGAGIVAQTGRDRYNPNYSLCIEKNIVKLDKINMSGILALGPINEISEKLQGGIIRDNVIYLKNGYEGIHVRKCDDFEVTGNKISGKAYYGIRVSGHRKFGDRDMGSFNNRLKENDLNGLDVKAPDDYVLNHSDGKLFSDVEPRTAYIWLDRFTKNNKIYLSEDKTLIDEGKNNELFE